MGYMDENRARMTMSGTALEPLDLINSTKTFVHVLLVKIQRRCGVHRETPSNEGNHRKDSGVTWTVPSTFDQRKRESVVMILSCDLDQRSSLFLCSLSLVA